MAGMIDPSAVIWSTPVGERAGKPLLVLLHGLGSHEGRSEERRVGKEC